MKRLANNKESLLSHESTGGRKLPILPKPNYLFQSLKNKWIRTVRSFQAFEDEDYRWARIRNLGIAPLAEEVIFRACLLPPLLASSRTIKRSGENEFGLLSPTEASWIAPLFFGVAHLHHFYEQYRRLPPHRKTKKILFQLSLGVIVQWTYTTLFGAYASHVFVRTGSLCGATLAHVFCNYMGLPNISFAHPTSVLYSYRWFLTIVYFIGMGLFAAGFSSALLFPSESVIPSLLIRDTS
eukprot:CAMPEP_0183713020 /NCGR_PEP_ID=MMETSP0737-20130205/8027_1 /TAXON_ID=385413 /ORGANISM="Thalassiosira miniscula, Strain CCMP1093" /LENGTH=238 /DNA_ID=CAMNT_0025941769 /DNA_START=392 /DNA_END=1108 /DNA_ORIENTATION=-